MGLSLIAAPLVATGFASLLSTAQAYIPTGPFERIKNCLTSPCPKIDESTLLPRVARAFKDFSYYNATYFQRYVKGLENDLEYLRLRKGDPLEKSLFISAAYDDQGLLDPKHIAGVVNEFSKDFDVKYTVADSVEQVCAEIKEAAETGTLNNVIIQGFGNFRAIVITSPTNEKGKFNENTVDLKACFSPLSPHGKIILFSAETGLKHQGNLAQKIANAAKRVVIAPSESISSSEVSAFRAYHLTLFHPSKDDNSKNAFKVFQPIYQKCKGVFEDKLHPREKKAAEVITKHFGKSYLSEPVDFLEYQEHLRLCKDDPKPKLLVLSASHDSVKNALDPSSRQEVYGELAEHYDFMYKVISTPQELCQQIKEASQVGNLKHIIIDAHGNPNGVCLKSECAKMHDWVHIRNSQEWKKCLQEIDLDGKLVLFSCNAGNSIHPEFEKDTIAELFAKLAKKTVLAPDELFYGARVKVENKENMELYHPSEKNWFWDMITFKKPDNTIKKFNP